MTAPLVADAPAVVTEPVRHCFCTACVPPTSAGGVTLCGQNAPTPEIPSFAVPPNACVVCVDLWAQPCARCGR